MSGTSTVRIQAFFWHSVAPHVREGSMLDYWRWLHVNDHMVKIPWHLFPGEKPSTP